MQYSNLENFNKPRGDTILDFGFEILDCETLVHRKFQEFQRCTSKGLAKIKLSRNVRWAFPHTNARNPVRTYAKKPGFYGKFIILTNGLYEETGFLGSECVSPACF
jgi:hypothetical protein